MVFVRESRRCCFGSGSRRSLFEIRRVREALSESIFQHRGLFRAQSGRRTIRHESAHSLLPAWREGRSQNQNAFVNSTSSVDHGSWKMELHPRFRGKGCRAADEALSGGFRQPSYGVPGLSISQPYDCPVVGYPAVGMALHRINLSSSNAANDSQLYSRICRLFLMYRSRCCQM